MKKNFTSFSKNVRMKRRILKINFISFVIFFLLLKPFFLVNGSIVNKELLSNKILPHNFNKEEIKHNFVFVTFVADFNQERKAAVLIKSIRKFGGKYSQCPIYIVLGDTVNYPGNSLKSKNVILLPVEMDEIAIKYPLAIKAYAAAQVEEIVKKDVKTLAWFDPETIVLGSVDNLEIQNNYACAVRPVFLQNNIGQAPDEIPNNYWSLIYKLTRLNTNQIPTVETIVDNKKVRAYFNCEVFSVDPKIGIFKEWVKILTILLKDNEYQKTACTDFLQRLFLHQAVLSAVVVGKVEVQKIKWLPLSCGYPMNVHDRIASEKKITSLDSLSCAILEDVWDSNPNWMKAFTIKEPLKKWIIETYLDFIKVSQNIYRIEGSCNSYLVTTKEGSVLIDPAGAAIAPEWFQRLIKKSPLKVILLTHGHNDHREKISFWTKDKNIPVIAQRELVEFVHYQDRLAGFFARRNAIWQRATIPKDTIIEIHTPIEQTILFADNYTYLLGDYHFRMIHTPGETPDHSTIWIPELKTVFSGDNFYSSFPNLYTMRGTKPRWALDYISANDTIIKLNPEYLLIGHGTPLIGNKNIIKQVTDYRNAIQFVHDATVKGINEGKNVYNLMREIKLPAQYNIGQFYGRVSWSVRGIYESYVGWFDENPTTMYDQPISSIFPDVIQLAGGTDRIVKRADDFFNQGELIKSLHLTDVVLSVDDKYKPALEVRLKVLKLLRIKSNNYIERIWLDYGIRLAEEKLKN